MIKNMANYELEFSKLILAEGGYINDKDDAGGETYLGISRKFNPAWSGWKQVDDVKKKFPNYTNKQLTNVLKGNKILTNSARQYYKVKYWDKLKLDNENNQELAHQIFDTGVNMGLTIAKQIYDRIKVKRNERTFSKNKHN